MSGCYFIIPETHYERLEDLPDTWWQDVKQLLSGLADLGDYNMSVNLGETAGQRLKHLHFWTIPRTAGKASSGKGLAALISELDGPAPHTAKAGADPAPAKLNSAAR